MKKFLFLFLTGSSLYPTLEVAWRGRTHFSMAIAGGVCLCLIDKVCNQDLHDKKIITRCFSGAGIITGVEFLTGLLVNVVLKLNVWDYSLQPLNVMGQICLPFTFLWCLATIPAMGICGICDRSRFLSA
jgi:hypothetical protein